MADFSHLSIITLDGVARYMSQRRVPTDEMLSEAFTMVEPPLLPPAHVEAIKAILGRRRGRPRQGTPSRKELAREILAIRRPDLPRIFLEALATRVQARRGLTEYERALPLARQHRKQTRDMFIRAIYRQVYRSLDGRSPIDLPHVGGIDVPNEKMTKSAQALTTTADVLASRLGHDHPSEATMLNLVSTKKISDFVSY